MAPMAKEQIINEFEEHHKKEGSPWSDWYVGITADINDRLFGFHKVPRENHWRIHKEAYSDAVAREIESYFLEERGAKGGPGGGGEDSRFVYDYKITKDTVQ